MRWPVLFIFAYFALALQQGLATLLQVRGTTPDLILLLVVFVAISAQPRVLAWAALALGVLVDLSTPLQPTGYATDLVLVGPGALGYLAAGYVAWQLRGLVFRESRLVFGAIVLLAGIAGHVVIVAVLGLRGLPWPIGEPIGGWAAADQLAVRFLKLIYTSALAMPLSTLLIRTRPWWGFVDASGKAPLRAQARRS